MTTLGEYIRYVRTHEPFIWSQQQLANECGLSAGYISQIENSEAEPSLKVLMIIAKAFNRGVGDLLQEAGYTVHEERIVLCEMVLRIQCDKLNRTVEIIS